MPKAVSSSKLVGGGGDGEQFSKFDEITINNIMKLPPYELIAGRNRAINLANSYKDIYERSSGTRKREAGLGANTAIKEYKLFEEALRRIRSEN